MFSRRSLIVIAMAVVLGLVLNPIHSRMILHNPHRGLAETGLSGSMEPPIEDAKPRIEDASLAAAKDGKPHIEDASPVAAKDADSARPSGPQSWKSPEHPGSKMGASFFQAT